jgi:hypothetical protein
MDPSKDAARYRIGTSALWYSFRDLQFEEWPSRRTEQ